MNIVVVVAAAAEVVGLGLAFWVEDMTSVTKTTGVENTQLHL